MSGYASIYTEYIYIYILYIYILIFLFSEEAKRTHAREPGSLPRPLAPSRPSPPPNSSSVTTCRPRSRARQRASSGWDSQAAGSDALSFCVFVGARSLPFDLPLGDSSDRGEGEMLNPCYLTGEGDQKAENGLRFSSGLG